MDVFDPQPGDVVIIRDGYMRMATFDEEFWHPEDCMTVEAVADVR